MVKAQPWGHLYSILSWSVWDITESHLSCNQSHLYCTRKEFRVRFSSTRWLSEFAFSCFECKKRPKIEYIFCRIVKGQWILADSYSEAVLIVLYLFFRSSPEEGNCDFSCLMLQYIVYWILIQWNTIQIETEFSCEHLFVLYTWQLTRELSC